MTAIDGLRRLIQKGHRRVVLVAPTGCHAAGQLLLRYDGLLVPVEHVRVGDLLMGPGGPREVLRLLRGRGPMSTIAPIKGDPFVVNDEHVLTLVSILTDELVDVSVVEYLRWSKYKRHTHKLIRTGVDFDVSGDALPIEPYFLGVLLGDGSLRSSIGVTKEDPEIVAEVERQAVKWGLHVRLDGEGSSATRYLSTGPGGQAGQNRLINAVRSLGLHGTGSFDKFVPQQYLAAGRAERLEMLAGLMDTDGSLSHGGYDFISASQRLSEAVAFLARSVGLAAYVGPCQKRDQHGHGGTYWRVSVSGHTDMVPCRIPRKKAGPRRQIKDALRTGFAITSVDEDDFFGFTLDGDGRYLLGDFTITHNSGKTVCSSEMIRSAVSMGRRVVFMAHRKELIDQSVDKLARFGVEAGVVMAQDRRRDDFLPVQVCSIQTLAQRRDRLPPADLIICDEAHHAASTTYREVLGAYEKACVIGLTATPWRSDKQGLSDLFSGHVVAATPAELMAAGSLVEYDAFAYASPDMLDVKTTAGDYNKKDLDLACNTGILVGSIVKEYLSHAAGRRAICFPVSIEHSKAIVAEFVVAGVPAAHVDCHMKAGERDLALRGLAEGRIMVVSSVGVLSEGFDCPSAEVAILARPTKSLGLYIQQVGRVLRPSPDSGKRRALVHDHSGNLLRHGFIEDPRDYALTATPTRERDMLTCPLCMAVFGAVTKEGLCPVCLQPIAPRSSPAADGGGKQLVVIDGQRIDKAYIQRLRAERLGGGHDDIADEWLVRAARATKEQKIAEYLRLINVVEAKGLKPGFAYHAYKRTFGVRPAKWSAEDMTAVSPATKPFMPYKRGQR